MQDIEMRITELNLADITEVGYYAKIVAVAKPEPKGSVGRIDYDSPHGQIVICGSESLLDGLKPGDILEVSIVKKSR